MAKSSVFSGWQILFSKSMLVPFIFGAIALSIASKAAYDLLIKLVGDSNFAIAGIGLGSFAVIVLVGSFLNKYLYHWRQASPLAGKKQPEKRKGLILLVSNEDVCRKAIDWHRELLSYFWLICSNKSLSIAEKLKAEYENEGTGCRLILISDEEVYDPTVFKKRVEEVYENLPEYFDEKDVVLDFTGLTSIASVGAVLGCLGNNRPFQYVPAIYDKGLSVIKPLDPIEVEISW